ncbi:MAG: anthranilate phosphoribosyltransferase, partial [Acidimicrobiia bacterium]|nr:anthranilate phosphoribosyltransferase [Acidimicrobiia bacterium]
ARMCIGTSDEGLGRRMIDVLKTRGVDRGFVVHGEDGIDEISTAGPTRIHRLVGGEVTEAEFTPEDFGIGRSHVEDLAGGDADQNMGILRDVLAGGRGPCRDAVVVNAAPAIVLSGIAEGFVDAVAAANESIDSGRARLALDESLRLNQQASN